MEIWKEKNLLSRGPNMTPGGLSYTEIQTYDIFLGGVGGGIYQECQK